MKCLQLTVLLISSLFISNISSAQDLVKTKVEQGVLEGFYEPEKKLNIFLGIPYAQPPVKELRWRAPQETDPWEGVKMVKEFADSPMQTNVFGDMIYRSKNKSEDCLYLNIWTPEINPGKPLPVLVYFYGGGFVAGDGSEPRYDGAALAAQGIVSVTVNYRLNIFGFFAHPELSERSDYNASGNYGLLDQHAALQWVFENIGAFGGDPQKITIAGESAGSISVSAQMASPLSKDMLAGAIGESGAAITPALPPVPLHDAEQIGVDFADKTGYSLDELMDLDTEELFQVYNNSGRFGFPAVIDGYFLPADLVEIFKNGEQAQIPLLVGWNSAEMSAEAFMQGGDLNRENYLKRLKEVYPETHEKVLQLYPASDYQEMVSSVTALASDRFISYSTWKWFDLHRKTSDEPVYRYLFTHIRPSATDPDKKMPGAPHASEIEYFLGNLPLIENPNLTETDYSVSSMIQKYLLNFIKTGDPNSEELLHWPPAEASDKNPPLLIMEEKFRIIKAENDERYRFLDTFYGNQ